jgi:RNA polymerase sigma factor (sigma-70 family)
METSQSLFWDYLAPLKPKLYNYIHKSLNFSPDADDVFQETVLHGLRYFRSFRRGESFAAWIFGIAHNEVRTHFKKSRRTESLPEPEKIAAAAAGAPGDAVGEVFRYAARLAPRERDIFFLFYESGFSIAEIAGLTRFKEGHIKLILFQARAALKDIMGVTHE